MKKTYIPFFVFLLFLTGSSLFAQSDNIMYFCERYDNVSGEINCSDRFTKGTLTVMVKLASPIYYTKVSIQLDKYDKATENFEYHSSEEFDIEQGWDYIHFNNIMFNKRGIFRVFLLSPGGETITSALLEII